MTLYNHITNLPFKITDYDIETIDREQLGGRTRTTTTVSLHGGDTTGRGEDVTYEAADHHALADADAEAKPTERYSRSPTSTRSATFPHTSTTSISFRPASPSARPSITIGDGP